MRNYEGIREKKGYSPDSSSRRYSDNSFEEDRAPQKILGTRNFDPTDNFETSFDEDVEYSSGKPSQYHETVPYCIKILFEEDHEQPQPKSQKSRRKDNFFSETEISDEIDLVNFISKF